MRSPLPLLSRHHCSSTCQAVYRRRLLRVVDRLSVAGGYAMELTARETVCRPLEASLWSCVINCSSRPMSVAGGCSVELTTRETVCLKTGIAPSLPSQYRQLYLFCSARAWATITNGASVGPFRFRLILVSLNTVHRFQLHVSSICFRLNEMEGNGNVTIFICLLLYIIMLEMIECTNKNHINLSRGPF